MTINLISDFVLMLVIYLVGWQDIELCPNTLQPPCTRCKTYLFLRLGVSHCGSSLCICISALLKLCCRKLSQINMMLKPLLFLGFSLVRFNCRKTCRSVRHQPKGELLIGGRYSLKILLGLPSHIVQSLYRVSIKKLSIIFGLKMFIT